MLTQPSSLERWTLIHPNLENEAKKNGNFHLYFTLIAETMKNSVICSKIWDQTLYQNFIFIKVKRFVIFLHCYGLVMYFIMKGYVCYVMLFILLWSEKMLWPCRLVTWGPLLAQWLPFLVVWLELRFLNAFWSSVFLLPGLCRCGYLLHLIHILISVAMTTICATLTCHSLSRLLIILIWHP